MPFLYLPALFLWLLLTAASPAAAERLTISLQAPASLQNHPVAGQAIDDSLQLLKRAFPAASVGRNRRSAAVILQLLNIPTGPAAAPASAPTHLAPPLALADRSFHWHTTRQGSTTLLQLQATTAEGVAAGLYGLLQERLGVRFIHPRQTLLPNHRRWPLAARFSFSGTPRFPYTGFHLHTLHPMELTEQLHDPARPGAFEEVAAYLDWLACNGQNTFQFFLLRDVDRETWIPHARRIIAYAHSRGIRCGVELSLAMLQQQAFQAITLLRPLPSYKRQVENTLAWLFQAPWDFITLESMLGEHLPLVGRLLPTPQRHLEQLVVQQYKRPLLYATHVITEAEGQVRRPLCSASSMLIHTVMCWSATELNAPVYGNRNQRFMLEAARAEHRRRPIWYWPESSYWVGFDTPVPLLLLPYLDSRWQDVQTMAGLGLQGHLTFSTGWEWGYWLMDWSIARWSWNYRFNGRRQPTAPLSPLNDLLSDPDLQRLWQQALQLQNRYLKDRELLRYLAASTPFAELPPPFDLPFQPTPPFRYRWLQRTATADEAQQVISGPVADLEEYAGKMTAVTDRLANRINQLQRRNSLTAAQSSLADELITGLLVTALRADHRALTLRALAVGRRDLLGGVMAEEQYLKQAKAIRQQALILVQDQETHYRYPAELLARTRSSLTAYPFGYLYPASVLFFWEREEQQVQQGRFDPLFMNLWDIRRTLGFESLLIR